MAGTTIGSATTLSAGYANSTPSFTLTNLGIIGGPGVGLQGVNAAVANSGIVTGSSNGVAFASAGASVTNFSGGTITGVADGVDFNSGGTLINAAGGTIAGGFNGVAIYNGVGFVANSGTISGSVGRAVVFQNSVANRLVMYPGAVFIGGAYGGSAGTSILELGSAAAIGTVSGIGSSYTRFGRITLDPGAYWHFTGTNTASTLISSGYLVNDGTIGGTVTVASGELINNNAASRISASTGVVITGAGAALMNAGQIIGDPAVGIGVSLQANGQVLNYGTISGLDGVAGAASVGGTVTNGGSITGGFGIALAGGAAVTNKIGGVIIGTSGAGVSFGHGGQLLNRQGAIITGGDGIGALGAATTVENAGTISAPRVPRSPWRQATPTAWWSTPERCSRARSMAAMRSAAASPAPWSSLSPARPPARSAVSARNSSISRKSSPMRVRPGC